MELRQLIYFEAVVRHRGFSHASRELHVAQPAISAQVQRLEAELGAELLRRTTRRVALTEAGELFLVHVRTVLHQLDQARAELGELADVLRGRIRIGATPVLGPLDLPSALAAFRRRFPSVALVLRVGLIAELSAALDRGDLDIVLGPVHEHLTRDHVVHQLGEETVVLAAPEGHLPERGNKPVSLGTLKDEPFVCLPSGTGLRAILNGAGERAGFIPRVDFETNTPGSVRELVSAGLGVALLAESAAAGPGPAIDVRRLLEAPRHPPIGAILPRDRSVNPATREFLKQLTGNAAPSSR